MKRSNLILDNIVVEGNIVKYNFSVSEDIADFFTTRQYFIEYGESMEDVPESILTIPFVATLMAFCWVTNTVLWVRELDRTFYDSIPHIKRAYQEIYHYFPFSGRVVPSILKDNSISDPRDDHKALLLFSGGADAHATYIRNRSKNPLLFNIQGWYGSIDAVDSVADADKRDINTFAGSLNLEAAHSKSNFALVVSSKFDKTFKKSLGDSWWHGFVHSMAFISIAIPLAFKRGIHEIIIASSLTTGLNHLCASNSTTDSEFRFAGTGTTLHDAFELNRQDKIRLICKFQKELDRPYFMRVCSFHDSNCCECEKCLRTVLGIVAEGSDPELFGFNIDKPLTEHWQGVMDRRIAMMGFGSENVIHWPHIKRRMKENYKKMNQEQKDLIDWFMAFDFFGEKKKAVRKYYRKNFFKILKRKLHL